MQFLYILLIPLAIPFVLISQESTAKAVHYNDQIIEQLILVNAKFSILMNSYDKYVPEEMDSAFSSASKQLDSAIVYIAKLKGFKKDAYFKEGSMVFLNSYKEVLDNEHKKMIELYKLPDDEYGSEEVEKLKKLRNQSNIKIDKAFEDVFVVQKKFAKKYQIKQD